MSNKRICPNCNGIVNVNDQFCIHCGSQLRNNESNLLVLKNQIGNFYTLCEALETIDSDKEKYPLISHVKSAGNNIRGIFLDDLFKFLCYLGVADGILHDREITLINYIFDANWSTSEIAQMMNTDLEKYLNSLPLSFMIFYEAALNFKVFVDSDGRQASDVLFGIYIQLGDTFIGIDGSKDQAEVNLLAACLKNLMDKLAEFKQGGYESTLEALKFNEDNIPDSSNSSLEVELKKLDRLIGLENVKTDVNSLINLIQVRQVREQRGMKQPPMSLHLVFSGNPGTGKTTVARILSKIYYNMGILSKGHLIETDRSGLVAGYIGHTAINVQKVVEEAMGGILFIDEAYTLSSYKSENDFGQEAIDTLLKAMEDHRDDLIVIVAGYPELMEEFLQSNPGLESRFNKFMYFEDYTADELYDMFKLMCDEHELILDEKADEFIKTHFVEVYDNRGENFGNGRYVRNLFENVLTKQANRISANLNISDEELNTLKYEDFQ